MTLIFVRQLSRRGQKLCVLGWIISCVIAYLPYHQPWPTVLLAMWIVVGRIALSGYHIGIELLTWRGLMQGFGLSVTWPLTIKVDNDLFATSTKFDG